MNKLDALALPTIGILGGGQLGRMLALAGARLGIKSIIYCPDANSPAFEVASDHICATYEDEAQLEAFAAQVDVITYEFENIPDSTVDFLAQRKKLAPNTKALRISQDRLLEKEFLAPIAQIAPFHPVHTFEDLEQGVAEIGLPSVLKTTRFGYDGKGQRVLRSQEDLKSAFEALAPATMVLEGFIPFACEISVIIARNAQGESRAYDPAENVHKNHILHTSTVPANVSPQTIGDAIDTATKIADGLAYEGVMGIEFFVAQKDGKQELLVNEIAPRVHNSGHWTESVCVTDQFEQHMRAVAGLPLGDTSRFADVQMRNLIGEDIHTLLDDPSARPHAYGKAEPREGRKMGHVNIVKPWRD